MISTTNDTCRLTVVTPSGWAELALPVHVPVAELIPVLLRKADPALADAGNQHSGWVLQRLGDPPLDEDHTLAALELVDGETVYLRPRAAEIPAYDFDDLIDGVAVGLDQRAAKWQPVITRRIFLGLQLLTVGLGLFLLLQGGSWQPRAIGAAVVSLVLLGMATVASRALGDSTAGVVLGVSSLLYAAVGAALSLPNMSYFAAPHQLSAGTAVTVLALLAMLLVGDGEPIFAGAMLVGLVTVAATGAAAAFSLSSAQGGALAAVIALATAPLVPRLSFRLARLRLPQIPNRREDLRAEVKRIPAELVLARAAAIDGYATGLFAAIGGICMVGMALLAIAGGAADVWLFALIGLVLVLRAQGLVSARQRMATVLPPLAALAPLFIFWVRTLSLTDRILFGLVGLLLLGGLFLTAAQLLPGRRMLPYWGRAGEIIEPLAAAAILPVLLAVLDVYSHVRTLGG